MGRERSEGRDATTPRTIEIDTGVIRGISGSVLYRSGRTEILCAATLEDGTPPWRGDGQGWLTGDYAMAPYSTRPRLYRPADGRIDGRSQEIRRLLGRSLRTSVDFRRMPGQTIHLDCQVLHADGGTRTASINAATIALGLLVEEGLRSGRFPEDPRLSTVLAISVGRVGEANLVDLDHAEDSAAAIDLNIVATPTGALVEVQGASESEPLPRELWHALVDLGCSAIESVAATIAPHLIPLGD